MAEHDITQDAADTEDTAGHLHWNPDDPTGPADSAVFRGDDADDTEGHMRRGDLDKDDDTEGHMRRGEDDDTEGHHVRGDSDEDDDTEGHRVR